MERFDFSYDSESDDLFIYLKGKKSAGAVELGNVILDFDENYDLVAMQILNVTEFFSKILSKIKEVSKIKEIKIEIVNFRNMDAIKFSISDNKTEEKANILIPHIKEKSPVLQY
ncbi:MAG: hypothetical protein KatS3mg096_914 [Candidatus Parcubacteria bacterium]|nr:MAG: hypothetical protein KatS3mg096_914 [Candidatus Parcubacteria bacterium]